jgi:hypothetical protein
MLRNPLFWLLALCIAVMSISSLKFGGQMGLLYSTIYWVCVFLITLIWRQANKNKKTPWTVKNIWFPVFLTVVISSIAFWTVIGLFQTIFSK